MTPERRKKIEAGLCDFPDNPEDACDLGCKDVRECLAEIDRLKDDITLKNEEFDLYINSRTKHVLEEENRKARELLRNIVDKLYLGEGLSALQIQNFLDGV